MIKEYFRGVWKDRYILLSLVNQDLQLKYKRSALGVAWAILTPLGLVLIIGTVYSIIFSADPREFIPMLFAGLNTWIFITAAADGGALSLLGAEGYLKQTTTNAQIFPLRTALVSYANLLYSVLAFFAIYLFLSPESFGPIMLLSIPGLIVVFFFSLALANLASVVNLNFRDYQPLQALVLQGLFYATPIIFKTELLSSKGFAIVYEINPFYYILEAIRAPMLGNALPEPHVFAISIGVTVLLFVVSIFVFMKHKNAIVYKF